MCALLKKKSESYQMDFDNNVTFSVILKHCDAKWI